MTRSADQLASHLDDLRSYLQREQPVLADLVDEYRKLDQIAYRIGLLPTSQSFADQVSWWPLISVLGTFSAGKSTFINDYLEYSLQRTGHQAVDDKFSVVCYAADGQSSVLPGSALDADPRFPFFSVGREIEAVAQGEGRRLDSYLQLKTCPSEKLKGKILVDSPGFDADDQRTATLSIADRIIERSDLVMVFFDAHRPEPGAIRDTLEHLVEKAVQRHDATKFIYILNQIDVTADEDNLEDVVAAWQRALAQKGLTAGRFYRIFSQTACTQIKNEAAAARLLAWREKDMRDLEQRIESVEMERAYRVADELRRLSHDIAERVIPDISERLSNRRRWVLTGDLLVIALQTLAVFFWMLLSGSWDGLSYTQPELLSRILGSQLVMGLSVAFLVSLLFGAHLLLARLGTRRFAPVEDDWIYADISFAQLQRVYQYSTRRFGSLLRWSPAGWSWFGRRRLSALQNRIDRFIQRLNDRYISPDGPNAGSDLDLDSDASIAPREPKNPA